MSEVEGYFGGIASIKAFSRRQKDHKLMWHTELRELIIERMKEELRWSLPEHRRKRRPLKGRVPKNLKPILT